MICYYNAIKEIKLQILFQGIIYLTTKLDVRYFILEYMF